MATDFFGQEISVGDVVVKAHINRERSSLDFGVVFAVACNTPQDEWCHKQEDWRYSTRSVRKDYLDEWVSTNIGTSYNTDNCIVLTDEFLQNIPPKALKLIRDLQKKVEEYGDRICNNAYKFKAFKTKKSAQQAAKHYAGKTEEEFEVYKCVCNRYHIRPK